MINNANRALGYLRRNFLSAPTSLKLLLYKSVVRSKLEYAASIWDPFTENLISSLELIQNNSARFILQNYNRTASVTSMKNTLQLPSLASHRKHARLCLMHKIMYHNPRLHRDLILPPSYASSRVDHAHKIGIPFFKTKCAAESFLPRTAKDWNHLPGSTASIIDHQRFCSALAIIV